MTRYYFFAGALLLLILIIYQFGIGLKAQCVTYHCLVFPEIRQWKLLSTYEDTATVWRGLLEHPEYRLRLERISRISPDEADEFVKLRLMQIQSQFDTARSPYPGAISDKIVCSDVYKPQAQSTVSVHQVPVIYFSGYFNSRLQYGSCIDDQLTHRVFTALFYCANELDWYNLEIIVPKEKLLKEDAYISLFQGIGCQRPSVKIGRLTP